MKNKLRCGNETNLKKHKNMQETNARSLSEKEVIEQLVNHGIEVIYKPLALIPQYESGYLIHTEADIYETLERLQRKTVFINKDPFSE